MPPARGNYSPLREVLPRFWILDLRFGLGAVGGLSLPGFVHGGVPRRDEPGLYRPPNPKSKIQNPKSKVVFPAKVFHLVLVQPEQLRGSGLDSGGSFKRGAQHLIFVPLQLMIEIESGLGKHRR